MESNDLYEFSNSLRANSTALWNDDGGGAFRRSPPQENDEEALMWASIERLPTYRRLKKGLLATSTDKVNEVDVRKLGFQERKNLLERLVKSAEADNEKFLLKLKDRMESVGIEIPTIEVRYDRLNIEADAYVGSRALPSFWNFCTQIFEGLGPSSKKHFYILQNVSGIIKPCRMTLLLGPPSSGKTTLLLALAGKLDPSLQFSGKITYNGCGLNEFVPRRNAAYISQHDIHTPEMTVRETLAFSARCQGTGGRHEWLAELSRREKAANIVPDPDIDIFMKAAAQQGVNSRVVTEYILKILGLEVCADTMVGDDLLRGVSGGQKKRVTTGEMLVGPSKALFMDEISTGLDSSTTYQIVNSIKQYIQIFKGTCTISLLQPAPETYNLFDDIILLSDGLVVYHGPREDVIPFFESMGFGCPERKGVADFLQEVTSKKDQKQYWTRKDEPYKFVTVKEFADAFQSFSVGKKMLGELATPFERQPECLTNKKYGCSRKELFKACMAREYLLMKRNAFVYVFKLIQFTIMAAITMTVFLRTKMHRRTVNDGTIYMGCLFFTVVMTMFNGLAEMGMTIAKLPVFYRQRDLLFFPAWAYALPTWILKIPISCAESAVWTFITYYVIGYDPAPGRLFKQYLILILINQMASGLFRLIASLGRNLIVASTFGSFALLVLFANSGFVLARQSVKKWWIWGYWISPMMYAQNAVSVNELLGDKWKHTLPNSNVPLGVVALKSHGFFPYEYWYWIGVGALIGFILLFNFCFVLALAYLDPLERPQGSNVEDEEEHDGTPASGGQVRDSSTTKEVAGNASPEKKKGMVLPFEPYSLVFDDIIYSVDMPQEMKNQGVTEDKLVLLKGVSGAFRPGVLTALMGVSGAGKTTLMDVLAGRKTGGYIEGNIKVNGYPKKQSTFARISGYCEQNDIHSPFLTIHESLLYSAWLRLPSDVNTQTRKMFVDEVMKLVELSNLKLALVGLPGQNGLSTEQRKRLTIAVELVANPSIIFMDEPTSGLDARAAAIVMRTVRNTVDTGRTVVCTIHQPSIDIFEAFDELFLMKRGGEEIYVGPLGHRSCHLIEYFEAIEGTSKIKEGYNPATWMLEVSTLQQEAVLGIDFAKVYRNSDLYRRNKELIKEGSTPAPGSKELYFATKFSQSFAVQCMACIWKQRISYWRNPKYTAVRFLFTTFIALIFGSMFWDLGSRRRKQQDLFNSMGCMYASVLFLGIQNAGGVQPVVAVERTVFYREKAAGMYSPLPYAFAQVIVEIPYIFVQTVVYGAVVYAMMGYEWTGVKFIWFIFFMYFTFLYFTFYGMMTVAVTPNYHVASIVAAAFYGLWNLFSGFLVPRTRIPVWWQWYYWICPVAWTLYGLIASQFGDVYEMLDTGETVKEFLHSYLGFDHDFLAVVAVVVVCFALLFAVIFAVSIKVFNFQNR